VGKGSSEAYAFASVSQGIMALAKDARIGFVLLCQLKADAEGREPDLASHADSDRPGKDGALVVHLWKKETDDGVKIKAKIQKHRNGPGTGRVIELDFDGAHQRITEIQRGTDDPLPRQNIIRKGLTP
jgi:hypothetical protein